MVEPISAPALTALSVAGSRPGLTGSSAGMAIDPNADLDRVRAQVNKAAEEFEAMFAAQMLQPMFQGLKSDGMFSGGHAEDTWRGFMVEALGEQIAKSGGLGIADAVRASLYQHAGLTPEGGASLAAAAPGEPSSEASSEASPGPAPSSPRSPDKEA